MQPASVRMARLQASEPEGKFRAAYALRAASKVREAPAGHYVEYIDLAITHHDSDFLG